MASPDIEVSTAETADAVSAGAAVLVDVREPHEWAAGRIAGARHIAMDALAAEAPTLPRDATIIFYCLSGVRSLMAASAFRNAGFDARSMRGGIAAWDAEGRPLTPDGGRVAAH